MESVMKRCAAIALFVLLVPALGIAQKSKKHNDAPPVFETAHSVFVEAESGDFWSPSVSAPDRQAIADVQDALRSWNRYTLAVHPEQADVILVVHRGRAGNPNDQNSSNQGLRPGGQAPGSAPSRAPGVGGDSDSLSTAMASDDDSLRVYTLNPNGKLNVPAWSRSVHNGLDAPGLILFQQLKLAVDRAYPPQAPATKPAS
jgi:hypothetical protein